jgi:hypothetical protein
LELQPVKYWVATYRYDEDQEIVGVYESLEDAKENIKARFKVRVNTKWVEFGEPHYSEPRWWISGQHGDFELEPVAFHPATLTTR